LKLSLIAREVNAPMSLSVWRVWIEIDNWVRFLYDFYVTLCMESVD